jgi:hypothetical protein
VDGLVEFLSREMEHLRAEHQRPGWTTWALLAALAAVAWLLLDVVGTPGLTWQGVALVYFVLSLACESADQIHSGLAPRAKGNAMHANRFALLSTKYGVVRSTLLLAIFQYGIICFLALALQNTGLHILHKIVVFALFMYGAFCAGSLFCLSYSRDPTSLSPQDLKRSWREVALVAACLLIPTATVIVVVVHMFEARAYPAVAEWRAGALAYGVFFVLERLSSGSTEMISHTMLVDIRRRLVLGHLDLKAAVRQTDIVLCGMTLGEVVENEVRQVMQILHEQEQEICRAVAIYETSQALLDKGEEDRERIKILLSSGKSCLERVEVLTHGLPEHMRKLGRRIGWAQGAAGTPQSSEADQITKKILDLRASILKRYNVAGAKHNELLKRLEQIQGEQPH